MTDKELTWDDLIRSAIELRKSQSELMKTHVLVASKSGIYWMPREVHFRWNGTGSNTNDKPSEFLGVDYSDDND